MPSPEGVDYYDRVFNLLAERIKIFLTLNHYAMPIYLVEQYGGWKGRECIEHFMRFTLPLYLKDGKLSRILVTVLTKLTAGYFLARIMNCGSLLKGENGLIYEMYSKPCTISL